MTEYIIPEDEYRAAMRKAYEAGAAGREVYTARDYLTRPLVRCGDCKHYDGYDTCDLLTHALIKLHDRKHMARSWHVGQYHYCVWGERLAVFR